MTPVQWMTDTLGTVPLLVGAGVLLAGLAAGGIMLAVRRTRRGKPEPPVFVGRKAFCSLCDTTFTLPLEPRQWARCPKCGALVPL